MEIYRPHKANIDEMTKYHSDDYIRFLRSIRPDNMSDYNKQVGPDYMIKHSVLTRISVIYGNLHTIHFDTQMQRFNVGEDCPVFDGLYEFCQVTQYQLISFFTKN